LSVDDDQWSPAPASRNEDWHDVVKARDAGKAYPPGFNRFVLHVGGESWYKNRTGVVRIFGLLPPETAEGLGLIMVGPPLKSDALDLIFSQNGMKDRVLCLQKVSDADLAILYRSAEALLFPSLDEGFGWPVLEAHACGCRVVCSRRGSLPEVGGSAAYYIDPDDEVGAAAVLEKVLAQTDDKRYEAKQAALANAARFSLSNTTRTYISIYKRLLMQ
jgi:glycosyltransferase involved in cell wall biosynthesis